MSGGGFFSWGTKFKYTGRTEREILTESINALREQKMTNSTASKRKASSVPATPSSPQGDLAQIRKLLRNSYISNVHYQFPNYYSGYSSLPRSTMSEPLGNCTMATTDSLGNIIYSSSHHPMHHDGGGGGGGVGVGIPPSLEPVSEEARLRASNIDSLNSTGIPAGDMISDYYFRDSVDHSSTESGLTNAYADAAALRGSGMLHHHTTNKQHLIYTSSKQQQHHTLPNTAIDSSTSMSGGSIPANILHHNNHSSSGGGGGGGGNNNAAGGSVDNSAARQNAANSAKSVRKFRLLHAFIPSFIFVVVAMAVSAILILESESELFERIRNLPEMISLRYQYYQPLKEFIVRKLGRKS